MLTWVSSCCRPRSLPQLAASSAAQADLTAPPPAAEWDLPQELEAAIEARTQADAGAQDCFGGGAGSP